MKRKVIIASVIAILVVTHGVAWCLGWKSGFVTMGKTEAQLKLPFLVSACEALESNNVDRLQKSLFMLTSDSMNSWTAIQTNQWFFIETMLSESLAQRAMGDEGFQRLTLPRAHQVNANLKERIAEP